LLDLALLLPTCDPGQLATIARRCNAERALVLAVAALDKLGLTSILLQAPSRVEAAYLQLALDDQPIHLGEAIAALAHPRWSDRGAAWMELLRPQRTTVVARLGTNASLGRWLAGTLARASGDALRLLGAALASTPATLGACAVERSRARAKAADATPS
jgi:hypothetical protein